jgi:hypothetical protein
MFPLSNQNVFFLVPKLYLGTNLEPKLSLGTISAFPSQAWEREGNGGTGFPACTHAG